MFNEPRDMPAKQLLVEVKLLVEVGHGEGKQAFAYSGCNFVRTEFAHTTSRKTREVAVWGGEAIDIDAGLTDLFGWV